MRHVLFLLLSTSLFFHAGCAVFGIATRGDLEEERQAARARHEQVREENRVLRDRFQQLTGTLEATEKALAEVEAELEAVRARADSQRQEIWSRTGDLQVRMAGIEDRLGGAVTLADSLRGSVDASRAEAQSARVEAQSVRQDLVGVSDRADLAHARSETLLRAWLQQLRDERGRLERQLTALEASLAQWESEVYQTTPRLPAPGEGRDAPAASSTFD